MNLRKCCFLLWIFPQTAIPPVIMNALEKKAFMKVRNHKQTHFKHLSEKTCFKGLLKMCSFLSGSRFSMPLYKSDLLDSGEILRHCLFAMQCSHGLKQWMNDLFYICISTVWCLPRRCAVLCSHRRGECFEFRNAFAMVCLTCWFELLFCLCEVLWRWTAWSRSFKRVYDKAILTSLLFILTRVCRKV